MTNEILSQLKMRTSGSENIEYDGDDAERFRNAYRSHFSDSFHTVFSEVISLVLYFFWCHLLVKNTGTQLKFASCLTDLWRSHDSFYIKYWGHPNSVFQLLCRKRCYTFKLNHFLFVLLIGRDKTFFLRSCAGVHQAYFFWCNCSLWFLWWVKFIYIWNQET